MPRKKPKPEEIPVTVMLDPDLVRMLEAFMPRGRTVADSIEELLVDPIIRSYFLEKVAPTEGYTVPEPVSDKETAAVQAAAAPMIDKLLAGHRKEAVAFGLFAAGLDLCNRIATDGGFVYPAQIADHLAGEILRHLQAKAADAEMQRLKKAIAAPQSAPEPFQRRPKGYITRGFAALAFPSPEGGSQALHASLPLQAARFAPDCRCVLSLRLPIVPAVRGAASMLRDSFVSGFRARARTLRKRRESWDSAWSG